MGCDDYTYLNADIIPGLDLPEIEGVIRLAHKRHGLRRLCILGGEPLIPRIRQKNLGVLDVCNEL